MPKVSREYCISYAPKFPEYFSIKEIFDSLAEGDYVPKVCEGFRFVAIGREEGVCYVAFPKSTGEHDWVPFEDVSQYTYKKYVD